MARGARGRNGRKMRGQQSYGRKMRGQQNPAPPNTDKTSTTTPLLAQFELDCKIWPLMPPGVKSFLLRKRESPNYPPGHVELPELVSFWTSPTLVWVAQGKREDVIHPSRLLPFLAAKYLEIGMVAAARTITLTAAFLDECFTTSIEDMLNRVDGNHASPDLLRENVYQHHGSTYSCVPAPAPAPAVYRLRDYGLNFYRKAIHVTNSTPVVMQRILLNSLPEDKYCESLVPSFVGLSSYTPQINAISNIGRDDWGGTSPVSKKSTRKSSSTGSQIELFLQDDAKEEERHGFSIDSGTTLKALFNDYADKRGISLRPLRFSYNGKTLFLSSVGNKTPDALSMRDQDVITVHGTSTVNEEPTGSVFKPSKKANNNNKKSTKKPKGRGGKSKTKQVKKQVENTPSLEECKTLHSETLTKLHEEAEPQLKEIRMRLNALGLERQPPKQKKRNNKKKSNKQSNVNADLQILPSSGIRGKAGKPCFNIHVGEVSNLYKTTKPSQKGTSVCAPVSSTMLDLHGFTQVEALQKLDESLITWVDAAMRGSYPFVIPAKIVCGCGNQVLSEAVEKWIHEHTQVRNSPKGQSQV